MSEEQPKLCRREANPGRAATSFVRMAGLPLLASAFLAACAAAEPADESRRTGQDEAKASAVSKLGSGPDGLPPAAAEHLTETDALMLSQAEAACKASDFTAFFEAMLRSRAARLRYFEARIRTPEGLTDVGDYRFPIELIDQSFIIAGSAANGPDNWEYVKLEFNQAQDERYRVDWVRVDLGPNGDDEGATPEDDREYGKRGYLLFRPTTACWTLAEEGYE